MKKISSLLALLSVLLGGCASNSNNNYTTPSHADNSWNTTQLGSQHPSTTTFLAEPRRRAHPESTPEQNIDIIETIADKDEEYSHPEPIKYSVQKGDSLWLIAKKHEVSLEELLTYNGLNKDSILRPKQELLIPFSKQTVSSNPSLDTETYVVKSGQTLSEIAYLANLSIQKIKDLNKLKSDKIYAGQKLKLPAGTQLKEALSHPIKPQNIQGPFYKVQAGDTLSLIAVRTGMNMNKLMELNNIHDPKKLRAGQVLKIEEQKHVSTTTPHTPEVLEDTPVLDLPITVEAPPAIVEDSIIFEDDTQAPIIPVELN